jgi:hypothetical protein
MLSGLLGCGSGTNSANGIAELTELSLAVLPPLPQDQTAPQQRMGSAITSVLVYGAQWDSVSPGVEADETSAVFSPPAATSAWAIYRLPGIAEDYRPQALSTTALPSLGEHYLGIANYGSGRWEFLPGGFGTGTSFIFDSEWEQYASPLGNFYCVVLSYGQAVNLRYLQFSVDDNRPLAAPTGLGAVPGELSAALSWDSVTDPRVSELRVYHSLSSDMTGASLLGSVAAAETQTVYNDLDHNVIHYFTLRSFSAALSQESPDSSIASCQPSGPVAGTFLPPTNLTASPGPGSALLSWDPYPDPRASHIRIYKGQQPDLSDAVLAAQIEVANFEHTVAGLSPGQTWYFAVTAWWQAAALESERSNIASTIPTDAPLSLMEGIWPRLGGDLTGSGYSSVEGPANLRDLEKVGLTEGRNSEGRTSPVLDRDGNVYAISRDAQINCFSPDLGVRNWRTDANIALDDLPTRSPLEVCGQAPVLDNLGNIYFAAVEQATDDLGGQGWLLSFDSAGEYRWRFDLGTISSSAKEPYPSLNIHPSGVLVACGNDYEVLYGIDSAGNEIWHNDNGGSAGRSFFADISMDETGLIGLPIYQTNPGIDPRPHWVSVDGESGIQQQVNMDMGIPEHIFGGIFLPGGFFYYPSRAALKSVKPLNGDEHDRYELIANAIGAPARNATGEFLFFTEDQGGGFSGFASFHCNTFNDDAPPTQRSAYTVSLGLVSASGKPAVDSSLTAYFADDTGLFHMIKWDAQAPPSETNPEHLSTQLSTSFVFSSVALTEGAAYVISDSNTLYMVGTPVTDR